MAAFTFNDFSAEDQALTSFVDQLPSLDLDREHNFVVQTLPSSPPQLSAAHKTNGFSASPLPIPDWAMGVSKLHEQIYQHLSCCGMEASAKLFLAESRFFPSFKLQLVPPPLDFQDPLSRQFLSHFPPPPSPQQPSPRVETHMSANSNNHTFSFCQPANDSTPTHEVEVEVEVEPECKEEVSNTLCRKMYACKHPGCTSVFTTTANRKRHEKLHSGEKPYACSFVGCGKSFSRGYDLKLHVRTHTKEKPYFCVAPGCGKAFTRFATLREHARKFHGDTSTSNTDPQFIDENSCSGVSVADSHPIANHNVCDTPSLDQVCSDFVPFLMPPSTHHDALVVL